VLSVIATRKKKLFLRATMYFNRVTNKANIRLFSILLVYTIITACNPLRQIPEGKYLLTNNQIKVDKSEFKEKLAPVIKQKPNRKVLGLFRFHMSVYTWAAKHPTRRFNKWMMNTIGEEPVLIDTLLMRKSSEQLLLYMKHQGYYDATIIDSVKYKRKKAQVYYNIKANQPYTIAKLDMKMQDTSLQRLIESYSAESLILTGDVISQDVCNAEAERITKALKNIGYYAFSQSYIKYKADTAFGNHTLKLLMMVSNEQSKDTSIQESKIHHQFFVDSVMIYVGFDPLMNDSIQFFTDTVYTDGYYFLYKPGSRIFNTRILLRNTLIQPSALFNQSEVEQTYTRLADIGTFKFVNIKFINITPRDSLINNMTCNIFLTPIKPKSYNIDSEVNYNGGNVGLAGYLTFRNNNAFRNGELIEFALHGSVEATPAISSTATGEQKKIFLFNTFDLGPEINLSFRDFLFPFAKKLKKEKSNIVTTIATKYNYEVRSEFKRSSANLSLGYNFRNLKKVSFLWSPITINLLDVNLSEAFENILLATGDKGLISSYQKQLIAGGAFSFVYSTPNAKSKKLLKYLRFNIETSGHTLYLFDKISNNTLNIDNRYTRFNIPYTTYTRPDFDFRIYRFFKSSNSLVYRFVCGVGYTYWNSTRMPFDKSFFAGGSNDQRAWKPRTLGPGSFNNGDNFNRIGDIKINSNVEYRFDILKIIEGAAFVDAGNIWNLKKDKDFPGAEITTKRFLDEIAIGTGLGVRFNFTFFIFRIDAGVRVKDPTNPAGQTWVYQNIKPKNFLFNYGIAYPF